MSQLNPYAPPTANIEDTEDNTENTELASRLDRFWGSMIDGLIMTALVFGFAYVSGYWQRMMSSSLSFSDQLVFAGAGLVLYVLLHGYLLARHGQTIGKRLMGMRIVAIKDGEILPVTKLIALRYMPLVLAQMIPHVGALFGFLDALFIFRKDRRCLHDLIAGTQVIRVSRW